MVEGFVAQFVGVALIATWTVLATGAIWYAFRLAGQARVSPGREQERLDVTEHRVETYPEFGDEGTPVADGGAVRTPVDSTAPTELTDGDAKGGTNDD